MKIDIHTHTKKCKSGDAPSREISPEKFCETILSTEVRIVAITNHNVFDLDQYQKIIARLGKDAQVWPGIELDIQEDGSRAHLLVIASPKQAKEFSIAVGKLTKDTKPDDFTASIDEVVKSFDSINPLYVAHYKQKKPNLSDEALNRLEKATRNPSHVIKEVSNAISAGIYISHGHPSIYGSDVHDWTKYEELSRELPELRLPVDSFEHFCLLLKKDATTINTLLNRKTSEYLVLLPFEDSSILQITAFNDINVVFGPKGTGKSCILAAIAKHYAKKGVDAKVYAPTSDRLEEIFDTKGKNFKVNLDSRGIKDCADEIDFLRNAVEVDVASMSRYVAHFKAKTSNRNAAKILLKDLESEEESKIKRDFTKVNEATTKTAEFLQFFEGNSSVKKELNETEIAEAIRILSELLKRLRNREWNAFCEWKETQLLNSAIKTVRNEVARKTGSHAKPTSTGFRDYAMNRIKMEICAREIIKSANTKIPIQTETVGSLGSSKGVLQLQTEVVIQNGEVTDSGFTTLSGVKKGPQKKFLNCIRKILKHAYAEDLFQHVSDLNELEDTEDIKTVQDQLLFKRYFALDGKSYLPSSGEASMVMLQKELETERDIYILDEPEKSLGNEYISDVIVPLIKERARSGKTIFISTHDANIAVRTLPYSSIFRCHGSNGYRTYLGNPFSNNLLNPDDPSDQLDWKKVSMKTLEGGEEAFGERGKIYGNA